MRVKRATLLVALALVISPRVWADNTGALFELIGERLALMDEVAAWKFERVVDIPGLSAETHARLFNAMLAIDTFPSRLDQIVAVGAIRIGTTGDYAPFSFRSDDGTLSGISRIPARQRLGFFSLPYHQGGKTPIARCEDVGRFGSLAAIDRPDVRVIVNPGGTNHKFVKQHLKRANVMIHQDNRTIFDEIVSNHADVMITDAIEVRLKAGQNDALCAAMPDETLTYQEKAYLMPRDEALREFVDTWLSLRIGDGTVERVFDRQLAD